MRTSPRALLRKRVVETRNVVLKQRARWRAPTPPDGLTWLFVAALPNSGTTALARLLTTSPSVSTLEGRGEGQWLVPQLSRKGSRWEPDHPIDYDLVRAVWFDRARRRAGDRSVVLEKSPSNIVRMRPLLDAFADVSPRLVVFTRDPMAVCASWGLRKTPETLVDAWMPAGTPPPRGEEAFFTLVGRLCGRRMAHLDQLLGLDPLHLTYEGLTESPAAFVASLRTLVPEIGEPDTSATLRGVKDYPEQRLRNMNSEQVARLSPRQRSWLRSALEPWGATLERLGYQL